MSSQHQPHATANELAGFRVRALTAEQMSQLSRHLCDCPACSRAYRAIAPAPVLPQIASELAVESLHLSYEQIVAALDAAPESPAWATVEQHVLVCESCAQEVAELRTFDSKLAEANQVRAIAIPPASPERARTFSGLLLRSGTAAWRAPNQFRNCSRHRALCRWFLNSAKGSALRSATNPGTPDADPVLRVFPKSGQGPTRPTSNGGTIAASVARELLRRAQNSTVLDMLGNFFRAPQSPAFAGASLSLLAVGFFLVLANPAATESSASIGSHSDFFQVHLAPRSIAGAILLLTGAGGLIFRFLRNTTKD